MSLWPRTIRIWFQTDLGRENSASYLKTQAGNTCSYHGHALVTRWSRSTSNFYALIGQNLTGEFMWKVYAASWNLLTLTAEADKVLYQLVMFLTVFFLWMNKMKYSCYQESSCYSWLVCLLGFWLRKAPLDKVGDPISDGIASVFHLAWCVGEFKSPKRFWPYLIAFRSCISNGKPE